jgi:hypothetical protein
VTLPIHYFVTDIEADGPSVHANSMLSFATVVVREDGAILDSFEAVLEPRPDRVTDAHTMQWWARQPEAYANATDSPRAPSLVMTEFRDWVASHDGPRAFAARPLLLDGMWIDHYLRDFANRSVFEVPYWYEPLFDHGALDIGSYALGLMRKTVTNTVDGRLPAEWLGNHPHSHRAMDDALGYASFLSNLLRMANGSSDVPQSMIGARS